jgi:hypothetical protein
MLVVLHSIVPHHHHFESHPKTSECESECPIEHDIDEHEHTFPEHCHAFNNIQLYDRKYNQQKNTIQFTVSLLSNYKLHIKQDKHLTVKTEPLFIYQSPCILLQSLRAPPVIS